MNYLDLFSGIGGFHLGLLQSGIKVNWCGFSEIDKYAKQVYRNHFPESEDLGDVKTVKLDRLPKINLVTFGFPCQDVSIAGKRGGLSASRSGLFYEAMRIIRSTRPDYFIFENVKGLFSVNEGRDWLAVLREVADSGYDGQWQLLNTRWFLPQNRERIYFVGHIRGQCRPEIFPIGEGDGTVQPERDGASVAGCVGVNNSARSFSGSSTLISGCLSTKNQSGQANWDRGTTLIAVNNNNGQLVETDTINNIDSNYSKGVDNHAQRTLIQVKDAYNMSNTDIPGSIRRNMYNGGALIQVGNKRGKDQDGQRIYSPEGIYSSLKAMGEPNSILINDKIRRLTPLECERLQGYPDGWTDLLSDTQRYKCLGNAVSVPVVKAIGEKLLRSVGGVEEGASY